MKNGRVLKAAIFIIILLSFASLATPINEEINILAGQEMTVPLSSFPRSYQRSDETSALAVNGQTEGDISLSSGAVNLKSETAGTYMLSAYAFGIKVKNITVNVLPNTILYPGGDLIGLNVYTKGVIAVKLETITADDGKFSPSADAGVLIGDIITQVNGKDIFSAEEFSSLVNASNSEVTLTIIRNKTTIRLKVTPVMQNGKAYIGLWVRNNVAGIGTLTYITSDMKQFAALGHAITDSTTGITIPVRNGDLVGAQIINLVKGKKNTPGEIHGMLKYGEDLFGNVYANNEYGIYGIYNGGLLTPAQKPLPIALQNEIHVGPATIITTVDGEEPKEYAIHIDRVTRQNTPSTKSMSISVTDPVLLKTTGGIIQGMSGSPIIQDGKIVGAVTHVLLNDPKKGYGVFIEWMLRNNSD